MTKYLGDDEEIKDLYKKKKKCLDFGGEPEKNTTV